MGLSFAIPALLTAFIALPILYYLLRLTPPPPARLPLPTLPLVRDLIPQMQKPQRSPWWLLALRLLIAGLIILAMAGPIWNSQRGKIFASNGSLVLILDNGWAAAADWTLRVKFAEQTIESAKERPIFVRGTAENSSAIIPVSSAAALEKLRGLTPQAFTPDRQLQFASMVKFLDTQKDAEIIWISDALSLKADDKSFSDLVANLGNDAKRVTIIAPQVPKALALSNPNNASDALNVRVLRVGSDTNDSFNKDLGIVRALDAKGRVLGETQYKFDAGATETLARFDMPLELRNDVSRLEIVNEPSAGAITLLDDNNSRRRVGIFTGESSDTAQQFVSPSFFLRRALEPFAEIREAPKGASNPVERLLNDNCNMIILADMGALSGANLELLTAYIEKGGMVVRFAGPKLVTNADALLPVKLRRGGRVLGGALSWDSPRKLGKFPEIGPFAGLVPLSDVSVQRQVLAEPDGDLPSRSWAQLEDGTPLVTGVVRGQGTLVLFHVTSDTTWSNLPISGQFVELLRRLTMMSNASSNQQSSSQQSANQQLEGGSNPKNLVAPTRILDGFGVFRNPPVYARPVQRNRNLVAMPENPAGFYGAVEASVAVNILAPDAKLFSAAPGSIKTLPLELSPALDLRPYALIAALILFMVDALAVMKLSGAYSRLRSFKPLAASIILCVLCMFAPFERAEAADNIPKVRAEDIESALVTRMAYVITGDKQVDEDSASGLANLTRVLTIRTALEPGDPIGVDLAKDELVFYPILFWPIVATSELPNAAALARINAYMKQGGTIVFDTRDAASEGIGSTLSPETKRLRQILSTIDVPDIEPIPPAHVVTKSFYLLNSFIGRYNNGKTWIEVLPPETGSTRAENRPARAGDRVSPIIITSNDLLGAWATDSFGQPRYPLSPGDARQREFSLRAGVNLVMYSLTGNYKSDQVHIDDLLQRLGQ
jgi:Domain of unknown function (DUF4159)/Aerotolerance regulator N-terminal